MPTERAPTLPKPPKRGKKYFTVGEAQRALKYIRPIVEELTAAYGRVLALKDRLEHPRLDDAAEQVRAEYERTMDQLNGLVDEIVRVGVEIKDFEQGLIDFPAIYQDREIYLCWHRGEEKVAAWHEVDAGYAGRQEIAKLGADPLP